MSLPLESYLETNPTRCRLPLAVKLGYTAFMAVLVPVNINYVHGMSDTAAQTWMPPRAWLATLMAGLPALLYWPTHLLLKKWFGKAAE